MTDKAERYEPPLMTVASVRKMVIETLSETVAKNDTVETRAAAWDILQAFGSKLPQDLT